MVKTHRRPRRSNSQNLDQIQSSLVPILCKARPASRDKTFAIWRAYRGAIDNRMAKTRSNAKGPLSSSHSGLSDYGEGAERADTRSAAGKVTRAPMKERASNRILGGAAKSEAALGRRRAHIHLKDNIIALHPLGETDVGRGHTILILIVKPGHPI